MLSGAGWAWRSVICTVLWPSRFRPLGQRHARRGQPLRGKALLPGGQDGGPFFSFNVGRRATVTVAWVPQDNRTVAGSGGGLAGVGGAGG